MTAGAQRPASREVSVTSVSAVASVIRFLTPRAFERAYVHMFASGKLRGAIPGGAMAARLTVEWQPPEETREWETG